MIPTTCCLKSFFYIVSQKTIRYSHKLYTNAILMAFMTNGQYHFSPWITGLKSNNARSHRSTPPIPWLYAAIKAGCWIFCFPFPFTHLFALPIGCTICNGRIVIPSYNFNVAITTEIKRSHFVFLHFLISARGHFIILSFLIVPVSLNPVVARSHINE